MPHPLKISRFLFCTLIICLTICLVNSKQILNRTFLISNFDFFKNKRNADTSLFDYNRIKIHMRLGMYTNAIETFLY
jgi:hypothetical protein